MKRLLIFSILISLLFSCGTPYIENKEIDSLADSSHPKKNVAVAVKDSLDTVFNFQSDRITMKVFNGKYLVKSQEFVNDIDSDFYNNGKQSRIINGPSFDFDSKTQLFYSNGQLKSEYQQGVECGMGIQVGEQLDYDSLGNLLDRITFDNQCDTIYNSGHNTWTVISTTEFYPGKKVKLKKQEGTGYESGGECPCGTWEYYDENGKLLKKEKYQDCNTGNMDCLDK